MKEDILNKKKGMKNKEGGFKVDIVGLPEGMLQDDST